MYGAGDTVGAGPDVVVFEHRHGAEVVSVRVAAADQHAVFLDKPETGCGLAGSGEGAIEPDGADEREERGGSGGAVWLVCRKCNADGVPWEGRGI